MRMLNDNLLLKIVIFQILTPPNITSYMYDALDLMFIKISACSTWSKSWMWFLYFSLGSVTYSDFSKIMKREKVPSQSDLMSLFKKLDRNRKGFMTTSELKWKYVHIHTCTHIHVVMTACFERHNVNESACMYMYMLWLMHVLKNKINVILVWNKRMLESCVMHVYILILVHVNS